MYKNENFSVNKILVKRGGCTANCYANYSHWSVVQGSCADLFSAANI